MTTYETLFVFDRGWRELPPPAYTRISTRIHKRYPRLDADALKPARIKSHSIPFYPDHELVRLTGFNNREFYPAYFIREKKGGGPVYLDGRSEPIHRLNELGALALHNGNFRQYLMFFSFFVHGDEGAFLILDTNNTVPVRRIRAALDQECAAPMKTRQVGDDDWEIEASLIYGQQTYRAVFAVKRSGLVEMIKDTPLDEIAPEVYRPKRFPDLVRIRPEKANDQVCSAPRTASGNAKREDAAKPVANMMRFLRLPELKHQLDASATDNTRLPVLQRYYDVLESTQGYLPIHATPDSLQKLDGLKQKYPNFVELVEFVIDEMMLATLLKDGHIHLPPLIVDGDPGIGKTRFLHDLADALGIHLETLDMASATAGFELSGSSSVWRGGRPGLVLEAVLRAGYANPMILLDELDKVPRQESSPIDGPLHALLEPVTARRFRDEYLKIQADFSHVNWIATSNDFSNLTRPIQSRFIRFAVKPPSPQQMRIVIRSIYADLLREQRIAHAFDDSLTRAVIAHLTSHHPTPRQIRTQLRKAIVAAAVRTHRADPAKPLRAVRIGVVDLLTTTMQTHGNSGDATYLM